MKCAYLSRFAHDISFKGDVPNGYKQNKQAAEAGSEGVVAVANVSVGTQTHAVGEVTFAKHSGSSEFAHAQESNGAFAKEQRFDEDT